MTSYNLVGNVTYVSCPSATCCQHFTVKPLPFSPRPCSHSLREYAVFSLPHASHRLSPIASLTSVCFGSLTLFVHSNFCTLYVPPLVLFSCPFYIFPFCACNGTHTAPNVPVSLWPLCCQSGPRSNAVNALRSGGIYEDYIYNGEIRNVQLPIWNPYY